MTNYYCNIGLEVHIRLNTKTKLFCRCHNNPSKANENICPYCLGHPGALPVLNKAVLEKAILLAHNIEASICDHVAFDRKNYFYPDLPKGYQITQYFSPIATGGTIKTEFQELKIERIHIEEDAAKMRHLDEYSLVDFNRSGAPLIEIVTLPHIKSPEEAAQVFRYIRLLAIYLGITDGVMQDGDLRCDANISIASKEDLPDYKVEIKNINSFKFMEKALAYEITRQADLLDTGQKIISETRTIDENNGKTYPIRSNESKKSYRYMKEPDIPKFKTPLVELKKVESPLTKHQRYIRLGLEKNAAEYLRDNPKAASIFDELQPNLENIKVNALFYLLSLSIYIGDVNVPYKEEYLRVLLMFDRDEISKDNAVLLLKHAKDNLHFDSKKYALENNLLYNNDMDYISQCIHETLNKYEDIAREIRSGNKRKIGALTGIIAGSYTNINPKNISQSLKNILG